MRKDNIFTLFGRGPEIASWAKQVFSLKKRDTRYATSSDDVSEDGSCLAEPEKSSFRNLHKYEHFISLLIWRKELTSLLKKIFITKINSDT